MREQNRRFTLLNLVLLKNGEASAVDLGPISGHIGIYLHHILFRILLDIHSRVDQNLCPA